VLSLYMKIGWVYGVDSASQAARIGFRHAGPPSNRHNRCVAEPFAGAMRNDRPPADVARDLTRTYVRRLKEERMSMPYQGALETTDNAHEFLDLPQLTRVSSGGCHLLKRCCICQHAVDCMGLPYSSLSDCQAGLVYSNNERS
jgi:hypothetical protein